MERCILGSRSFESHVTVFVALSSLTEMLVLETMFSIT